MLVWGRMSLGWVSAAQILFSAAAYLGLKPIKVLAMKGSCKEHGWVVENRIQDKWAIWRCLEGKFFIAVTSLLCLLTPVLGPSSGWGQALIQARDGLAVIKNLSSHLNSWLKLKLFGCHCFDNRFRAGKSSVQPLSYATDRPGGIRMWPAINYSALAENCVPKCPDFLWKHCHTLAIPPDSLGGFAESRSRDIPLLTCKQSSVKNLCWGWKIHSQFL